MVRTCGESSEGAVALVTVSRTGSARAGQRTGVDRQHCFMGREFSGTQRLSEALFIRPLGEIFINLLLLYSISCPVHQALIVVEHADIFLIVARRGGDVELERRRIDDQARA